tara:strand:+ start:378 stop:983 length:606 start_codon:yes stop_codon:yes gene_type:complete
MKFKENKWDKYYKKRLLNDERLSEYQSIYKPYYDTLQKYVKPPAKLLEVGCGGARLAICISRLGYSVTATDNDPDVLEIASRNGKEYGGEIKFRQSDAFKIDEVFGLDSFDACTHHGVIEHFEKGQIVDMLERQLKVAKYLVFGLPVLTESNVKQFDGDGIYRNLWTTKKWVNDILSSFNIVECFDVRHKSDDMVCVIKRD